MICYYWKKFMDTTKALEELNKAALKILSAYPLEKLCEVIAVQAMRLANAKYGSLYLYNADKLEAIYSSQELGIKIKKKSFLQNLSNTKKITGIPDRQIQKMLPGLYALDIRSVRIIPLNHRNSSQGRLVLYSESVEQFRKSEVHILKLFASLASLAITKTQQHEETERALEMRDRFISLASHELRTPLTSINGYIQLLHRKLANQDTVESRWMEELYHENIRFIQLVKDLLDINRIKQGQLAFVLSEVNVKNVIEAAMEHFRITHPERKITFFDKISDCRYLVIGDSEKLIEMISALLGNAIKFSESGTTLTVSLSRMERFFHIILKDQGKGIPQKDLSRIFEGFYKTKYSREKEGMGVGLLLARHIISLHRGKMEIVSKEGKGTTVSIQLPAVVS